MILNSFALTSLFIGIISLLLMAAAALSAFYFHHRLKSCEGADERARAENGIHLSLLFLFTAFILRLASWPLFYILLHSLIPIVPGAMCIYGVTQVMPPFVIFLEILKPLSFFLIGGWLFLYGLDLSSKSRSLFAKSIQFLIAALAVAAIDGIAEIIFLFSFSPPGVAVSCCTVIADMTFTSKRMLPIALFSTHYHSALMATYHGFNLGLAALLGVFIWKKLTKRSWLLLAALIAATNAVIAYGTFKEYLGPRLMNLPDHHCLYCLLQYRPISILILALFILGSFLALWPYYLSRAVRLIDTGERSTSLNINLFKWAIACLLASWLIAITA